MQMTRLIGPTTGAVIFAATALLSAFPARAQAVVPPASKSFPLTYGEWGARWWQYIYGIPADQSPLTDATGQRCQVAQWGPVFFLVGTATTGAINRSCTIPAGAAIFFPIINVGCAIPEDGKTPAEIQKACSDIIDQVDPTSLKVTIDGKSIPNLDAYRASDFFSFTGVEGNPYEETGCATPPCYVGFRQTAFADGYWVMARPLPPGQHVVHFEGAIPEFSFVVDVTYHLNIEPAS